MRARGGGLDVDSTHVAGEKTVEGREGMTAHSPSIAHQATIHSLECHYSQKKEKTAQM